MDEWQLRRLGYDERQLRRLGYINIQTATWKITWVQQCTSIILGDLSASMYKQQLGRLECINVQATDWETLVYKCTISRLGNLGKHSTSSSLGELGRTFYKQKQLGRLGCTNGQAAAWESWVKHSTSSSLGSLRPAFYSPFQQYFEQCIQKNHHERNITFYRKIVTKMSNFCPWFYYLLLYKWINLFCI